MCYFRMRFCDIARSSLTNVYMRPASMNEKHFRNIYPGQIFIVSPSQPLRLVAHTQYGFTDWTRRSANSIQRAYFKNDFY